MFVLIILGVSIIVVLCGVAYDYFGRKSFTEAQRRPTSQGDGRVLIDVATNQATNSTHIS
jgi:hypothetical protein